MASLGMDPPAAAERLGHTDGGALFLRLYRHLCEGERRRQAAELGARVQALLDEEWTEEKVESDSPLNEAAEDDGRTWHRTRELQRLNKLDVRFGLAPASQRAGPIQARSAPGKNWAKVPAGIRRS